MKNNLTIVVLTHNDELRIVDCLERLGFADELVVVDDNSTDRTVELARQYTQNIFVHDLAGNFSNQRNFALNHVHNQWVLYIDSDEYITKSLQIEIMSSIQSKSADGYFIKRVDYMWGSKIIHGEAGEVELLRLARKNAGKWSGKVHEEWKVRGNVKLLQHALIHAPHQSVREFISEVDEYSTLRAYELHEYKKTIQPFSIIAYPLGKFLKNYFLKRGYKDGIPGFLYAVIMSFHSFLVRAKLYQLIKEQK